jgi:hypothetical protein
LDRPAPPRYWAKVVAAIQGIVLTVTMAGLLPTPVLAVVVLAALGLLVESFGRQVWWLFRHARPDRSAAGAASARAVSPTRRVLAGLTTAVAVGLVWFGLVGPSDPSQLDVTAFLRIPLEALIMVALVLTLPRRAGQVVAVLGGVLLGVLTVIKLLDIGFLAALDRPFNPLSDWSYARSFVELLGGSLGDAAGTAVGIATAVLIVGLLVLLPLAVRRLVRVAGRDRALTYRFVGAFGVIWLVAATVGLQVAPGAPLAAAEAAETAYQELSTVRAGLADREDFAEQLARPTLPPSALTGLAGKDVVIAFVESYGRVAVQDPAISPGVEAVLDNGTRQLTAAGFGGRSAFLTSPTFGGISWLAHSTLESGLWVNNQARYDQLTATPRATLISTFRDAGWRTVLNVPANTRDWPEGQRFYGPDRIDDARTVGYRGPPRSVHPGPLRADRAGPHRPRPGDGRDRPAHQPFALGSAARAGRLGPGRRRHRVHRDARALAVGGSGVGERGSGPGRLRRHHRVQPVRADLVRADLRRRRPGPGGARRSSAGEHRQRRRRRARRPGDDHQQGPRRARRHRPVGLAARTAPRSAGAGLADGRVRRPLPARLRVAARPIRVSRVSSTGRSGPS